MYPHRFWTTEEDATLAKLWGKGVPGIEIAEHIGRSYDAVRQRVRTLDLPKRNPGGPSHGERDERMSSPHRLKRTPNIKMLRPRNGNFDSRRALMFLVENWRAA